jgi:hypothetical protein
MHTEPVTERVVVRVVESNPHYQLGKLRDTDTQAA